MFLQIYSHNDTALKGHLALTSRHCCSVLGEIRALAMGKTETSVVSSGISMEQNKYVSFNIKSKKEWTAFNPFNFFCCKDKNNFPVEILSFPKQVD